MEVGLGMCVSLGQNVYTVSKKKVGSQLRQQPFWLLTYPSQMRFSTLIEEFFFPKSSFF